MPGTIWDPLCIQSHLGPTFWWGCYIIPIRELNFKEIICLQSHGPCLSKARARVLAKHCAASLNSTTVLDSVPRVLTDIMSFQSSWHPVRMAVSSPTDLPKCSTTGNQLHVSSSSVALWLGAWCSGKGPVHITLLNEGFEASSRRVRALVGYARGTRPQPPWHQWEQGRRCSLGRSGWDCRPFPAGESGGRPGWDLKASEWEKGQGWTDQQ